MTSREYATLIFYWLGDPQPGKVDEIMATLDSAGWARDSEVRCLRTAAAVFAFEELYPDSRITWRAAYPDLFARSERAVKTFLDRQEWTDFLFTQWFILRRDSLIRQILERAGAHGERCEYTVQMINKIAAQHAPFRVAAQRLKIPVLVATVN